MLLLAVSPGQVTDDIATTVTSGDKAIVEKAETITAESSESEAAKKELDILTTAVNEIIDITVEALAENDLNKAEMIEPLEETIDDSAHEQRDDGCAQQFTGDQLLQQHRSRGHRKADQKTREEQASFFDFGLHIVSPFVFSLFYHSLVIK